MSLPYCDKLSIDLSLGMIDSWNSQCLDWAGTHIDCMWYWLRNHSLVMGSLPLNLSVVFKGIKQVPFLLLKVFIAKSVCSEMIVVTKRENERNAICSQKIVPLYNVRLCKAWNKADDVKYCQITLFAYSHTYPHTNSPCSNIRQRCERCIVPKPQSDPDEWTKAIEQCEINSSKVGLLFTPAHTVFISDLKCARACVCYLKWPAVHSVSTFLISMCGLWGSNQWQFVKCLQSNTSACACLIFSC